MDAGTCPQLPAQLWVPNERSPAVGLFHAAVSELTVPVGFGPLNSKVPSLVTVAPMTPMVLTVRDSSCMSRISTAPSVTARTRRRSGAAA